MSIAAFIKELFKPAKRVFIIAILLLCPSTAFSEGSSNVEATQYLRVDALLYVDILDADTETFTWTGNDGFIPISIEVFDPNGISLGKFPSGSTITPTPGLNGRYQILLDPDQQAGPKHDPTNSVVLEVWEIVVNNPVAPGGRLSSLNWMFNSFSFVQAASTSASFYIVTDGGDADHTTVTELKLNGFAGFVYDIKSNNLGVDDYPGRSIPDPDFSAVVTPKYYIYLNPPTNATYSILQPTLEEFSFQGLKLNGEPGREDCHALIPGRSLGQFRFITNVNGSYHVVCDLNHDGIFDFTSDDDVTLSGSATAGTNTRTWNGTDNHGNYIAPGTYDCMVIVTVGECHYVAQDAETSYLGLRMYEIPSATATPADKIPLNMYWNDYDVEENEVEMPCAPACPNGNYGLISSGPDGINSGNYINAPVPNVTSRAWGNFGDTSKGNLAQLDTFSFIDSTDLTTITIAAYSEFDPNYLCCLEVQGGGVPLVFACNLSPHAKPPSQHEKYLYLSAILLLVLCWGICRRKSFHLFVFTALILLLLENYAWALNVQALRPSTGAVQGYQLFTSETLSKRELSLGLNIDYDHEPLEIGNMLDPSRRVIGIVDQFLTLDFMAAYGAWDWLNLELDFPFNLYHNIAPTFIPTRDKGGADPGDLRLDAKVRFYDAHKTRHRLGLAVVPFITLPTGRESIFFGDESVTGGFLVVGDKQWKANRFYINLGPRFRKKERVPTACSSLIVGHEFLYGVGFQRPIWKKQRLDIIVEGFGSTTFDKFFSEEITSPFETIVLLRKNWGGKNKESAPPPPSPESIGSDTGGDEKSESQSPEGQTTKAVAPEKGNRWVVNAGGGLGWTRGYSTAHVRGVAGVSYTFKIKPKPPPRQPKFIKLREKIHFKTDRANILAKSYPTLDEVVRILETHPEIEKVEIEGHTDSRASEAHNQKLSERRAKAVYNYLVEHGINPDRLTWVGYGESRPIATNKTVSGRAQNRRTVLRILEVDYSKLPKDWDKEESVYYQEGDAEFQMEEALYPDS